jgi:hypothetical protein
MKRIFFTIIFTFSILGHCLYAQNGRIAAGNSPDESRSTAACDPVSSVQESFENSFPPDCWANDGWERIEALADPYSYNVAPQDEKYMLRYDCELVPEQKVRLTTPCFLSNGEDQGLHFWFYRDSYYPGLKEKLNIYLSETGDITGLSPVATLHRSIEYAPVVARKGWYEYRILLPCAGMTSAYVTIEAEGNGSEWGGAIFIDNISIKNICMPPENFTASLSKGVSSYNNALLSWSAPQGKSSLFSGFNLYRNGTLLADNLNTYAYYDTDLQNGEYAYSIEAIYSNDCGASEMIQAPAVTVFDVCDHVWKPENLTGKIHANEWYNIDLKWENTTEQTLSHVDDDISGAMGGAQSFVIASRFTPADLSKYSGMFLTKMSFVPRATTIDYILKVWKGGSDLNPGTEIYSQTVSAGDLNIGLVWNEVELSSPVPIDVTQEMWIGIAYENVMSYYPAGFDNGPIAKDGYSNLIYYDGNWTTLFQLNAEAVYNWCLGGIVKVFPGNENVTGYNVYRNNTLVNASGLVETTGFRDLVPAGAGTYSYEISAVYDNFCESEKTAPLLFNMPAGPCDNPWNTPVVEGFESGQFPEWCWKNTGEDSEKLWDRVEEAVYPTCLPHGGNGMLRYNCHSYMENYSALFISPQIATPGDNYTLSFWFYRDNEVEWMSYMADRVNVYLSATDDIRSLAPILTVHRSTELEPKVTAAGWQEYRVPLNTASMDHAQIIFEGISMWGASIYMDDISVYNSALCSPATGIAVEQPLEGNVHLSWQAPVADDITGYRIERDGRVIAESQQETAFAENLPTGQYRYCITALYNKSGCTESEPLCVDVNVIPQCDPVSNVRAERSGPDAVRISWEAPEAALLKDYSIYRNGVKIGNTNTAAYSDENLPAGPYRYGIVANYDEKDCTSSEATVSNQVRIEYCDAVTNLRGDAANSKIVLNWDFAGSTEFTEVLFHEGFENGIPSDWLNLTNDDDYAVWNHQTGNGQTGSHVYSQSYADFDIIQFPVNPNNWLITPAIDLYGTETLEYYISSYAISPKEHYGVFISTAGTAYDDFTLLFEETLTAGEVTWKPRKIDLSAYQGKVYIAFRHYESFGHYALKLDEITVRSTWGHPSFNVYRNDVLLGAVNETGYTDTNVQEGITYTYCVRPVYSSCEVSMKCIPMIITSIDGVPADNIVLYPNPASDKVFVSGKNLKKVSIYNLTGQLIEQVRADQANAVTEVSLSDYRQGVYLFKIETSNELFIREIIKK